MKWSAWELVIWFIDNEAGLKTNDLPVVQEIEKLGLVC